MEDVDFAKGWLALKAHLGTKRSHGQDELLAEMSRIEIECSEQHAGTPIQRHDKQHRSTRSRPLPDNAATAASTGIPHDHKPTTSQEGRHGRNGHAEHAGAR